MSIIKTIKQVLGLGPNAENHFWDGSVPNQLSLKRGTPDAPGAELIKALNGVLSFPNQGQSLTGAGYIKLPGGLIVQWGSAVISTTAANTWASATQALPTPFPTAALNVVGGLGQGAGSLSAQMISVGATINGTTPLTAVTILACSGIGALPGIPVQWIAIGY